MQSLAAIHRSWGLLSDHECRWLIGQGVDGVDIIQPYPIGAAKVRFVGGGTFHVAPDGERALTFRAEDHGEVIDLIAWAPEKNRLATWGAKAFCLGDCDCIFNPATYFADGKLRIHASPLEWLKDGRQGIVIVQARFAYAYLRDARLVFADPLHAERVQRWCRAPEPKTKFDIDMPGAAA